MKITVSKKLVLLFLAGCTLATANAQIQFGVKAGANFAIVTGDVSGTKTLVGFHGGVTAAIPVSSLFSVQPELVYSGQGAKSTIDGTDIKSTLNYLNIPVLLKYNNESGFFAETGPQIGFLLSAKMKSGSTSVDAKSSFKSTDFSWAFGAGYLIKAANIGLDVRYNLGLSNISADNGGGKVKNGVFQAGVFYLFGGGGKKK